MFNVNVLIEKVQDGRRVSSLIYLLNGFKVGLFSKTAD